MFMPVILFSVCSTINPRDLANFLYCLEGIITDALSLISKGTMVHVHVHSFRIQSHQQVNLFLGGLRASIFPTVANPAG